MAKSKRYTDAEFTRAIASSTSFREALAQLGLRPAGGNYACLRRKLEELGLDTSHMTGYAWNSGKTTGPKRPLDDYLVNQIPIQSYKLKLRLLAEGIFKYQCSSCKLEEWLGRPVPLELEHIDGNSSNNRLDNLTLLCPNCHAFTSTYRGRKKRKPR